MAKKKTQMTTKKKVLMSTLIPLSAAVVATAIAVPLVLLKKDPVTPGPEPTPEGDKETVAKINSLITSSGKTFTSMSSLLTYLKEQSINLQELQPKTTDAQFVWDKDKNTVFLMNKDGTVAYPQGFTPSTNEPSLWRMVTSSASSKLLTSKTNSIYADIFKSDAKYSQFLRDGSTFTDNAVTFSSGLDTGNNTSLVLTLVQNTELTAPTEPITIVTNGAASLTINSSSFDNIEHEGTLLDLNLNTLATGDSFSTSGEIVGDVIIAKTVTGSFVIEEEAIVNTIFVNGTQSLISVKTENVGTIAGTDADAKAALQTNVTVIGVPEETKTKIIDPDVETIPTGSDDLSGLGTERSPYVVTGKNDFKKIHDYVAKGYKHYIFESTTKEIDGSDWETNDYYGNLYGSFDGNDLVINNLSRPLFNVVGDKSSTALETMKISNVTLNCDITIPSATAGVARSLDRNAIFENVNVHGYISGAVHVGGYVCYGPKNVHSSDFTANWQFINCQCDAMISGTGSNPYTAAFVAHRFADDYSVYTFKNSVFTGIINNTNDFTEGQTHSNFAYFITGPIEYSAKVRTYYTPEFISQYNPESKYQLPQTTFEETEGEITYKCFYTGIDASLSTDDPNWLDRHEKYVRSGYVASGMRNQITLVNQEISGEAVQTLEVQKQVGAQTAAASLFIGPNGSHGEANLLKSFETEELQETQSGESIVYRTNTIKNYNVYVNQAGHETPGIQGDDYNIYDTAAYQTTDNPQKYILLIQYKPDNAGRLIPFYTTKFTW